MCAQNKCLKDKGKCQFMMQHGKELSMTKDTRIEYV